MSVHGGTGKCTGVDSNGKLFMGGWRNTQRGRGRQTHMVDGGGWKKCKICGTDKLTQTELIDVVPT